MPTLEFTAPLSRFGQCFLAKPEAAAQFPLVDSLINEHSTRAEIAAVRARQLPIAEVILRDVRADEFDANSCSREEIKHLAHNANLDGAHVLRVLPVLAAFHAILTLEVL